MAIKLTAASFLGVVRKSRLIEADRLERLLQEFQSKGVDASSSRAIARELVAAGILTDWQVERLLQGDHQGVYLGRYRLLDLLGEGGMSQVYLAEHDMIGQKCAIKVLTMTHASESSKLARFHREAQAVASLSHPNIVRAQHFDTHRNGEEEIHYLVMEYVEGPNLYDIVQQDGPLGFIEAADYIRQAASGLEHAHQCDMVHRDIKPGNLVVNRNGVVKILDLGLVRIAEDKDPNPLTIAHGESMMGTFDFMAPEQAIDSHEVDARADIYSLGSTFYFALTGHVPFPRGTLAQRLMWQQTKDPSPVTEDRPESPPPLVDVLEKMMQKNREDRFQTAGEVARVLEDWLGDNADQEWKRQHLAGQDESSVLRKGKSAQEGKERSPTRDRALRDSGSDLKLSQVMRADDPRLPANRTRSPAAQSDTTTIPAEPSEQKTTAEEPAVGIDIGTTSSVVATLDNFGRPATVRNAEGNRTTPSVVFFDQQAPLVGREAVNAAEFEPERIARFAKRELGQAACRKTIRGEPIPPEVVQALVLKKLWSDAELELGPFTRAVLTVPAFFDTPRRQAAFDAARLAGIDVADIINEPTAVAVTYGIQQGFLNAEGESEKRETILVYDLGGGSFDAAIMQIDGRNYTCLGSRGDVRLGGIDWDQRIVDLLAERFVEEFEADPRSDPFALEELRQQAIEAKHALSIRDDTTVQFRFQEHKIRVSLARAEFESLTADLLARTLDAVRSLLEQTGLAWSDLTQLVLAGGATRMPMVHEMLERESGLNVDRSLSPEESIAHGAAIYAGMLAGSKSADRHGISVQNVNSYDLGLLARDARDGRTVRQVLIARNTPLPATGTRTYVTAEEGQEILSVDVVEGGDAEGRGCTTIAECVVKDLPPDLPAGTPIEILFTYSQNGQFSANAWLPSLNRRVTLQLNRAAGLSETRFAEWSRRLEQGLSDDSVGTAEDPPAETIAPAPLDGE